MAKVKSFDTAEYLDSPEMVAAYLTEAFESDDPSAITMAIGAVARSQGMGAIAEKAGLSRENLYRSLGGEAKPELAADVKFPVAPFVIRQRRRKFDSALAAHHHQLGELLLDDHALLDITNAYGGSTPDSGNSGGKS